MWKLRARALLAALTGVLCLGAAPSAFSDVRLSQRGCQDYDRARLEELLAIEVETIGSELRSRPSDVFLECADGVVSIRVALRDDSSLRRGRVDPRSMDPAARTRLLALRISELLAQLWSDEPRASPAKKILPSATEERAAPLPGATVASEFLAYAGPAFRSMFEPRAALIGASLGAEYQALSVLALAFDVEGAFGKVHSEHADVDLMLGSAALHAAAGPRFGHFALGVGPGARLGWVNLSPRSLEPNAVGSDVSGVWAGPLLMARAKWSNSGFVVYSRMEAGVVTLPVVGTVNGEAPEVELRGPWFAACLGAGAGF